LSEIEKSKLTELAEQINWEHHRCEEAVTHTLQHALNAGELLIEAKSRCSHGTWQAWLDANFDGSVRTAQAYMRVAARRGELEAKTQGSAPLSLDGALKVLTKPAEREVTRVPVEGSLKWDVGENPKVTRIPFRGVGAPPEPKETVTYIPVAARETDEAGEKTVLEMYAEHGKLPGEGSEIVRIVRAGAMEYVVEYGDGTRYTVLRRVLLERGWKKCDCCGGYGIVEK
jgi:hypothetical protein